MTIFRLLLLVLGCCIVTAPRATGSSPEGVAGAAWLSSPSETVRATSGRRVDVCASEPSRREVLANLQMGCQVVEARLRLGAADLPVELGFNSDDQLVSADVRAASQLPLHAATLACHRTIDSLNSTYGRGRHTTLAEPSAMFSRIGVTWKTQGTTAELWCVFDDRTGLGDVDIALLHHPWWDAQDQPGDKR